MPARALLALALVLAVVAVLPAVAGAAPPSDLSADPLDRAALLALPSVYRVDMTIRVSALRRSDGTRLALSPHARTITEYGTAVAVAPGGWLVTAAHVVAPDRPLIARLAYQSNLADQGRVHSDEDAAAQWVEDTGARPVGARVAVTVTQADAGAGMASSRRFQVLRVVPSATADLALIKIRAPGAPALALDEAASKGTPVVTIGFGTGSHFDGPPRGDLEPAIRRGAIIRTGLLDTEDPPRRAIAIAVPVEPGDSGAPVVDSDGHVRGIVTQSGAQGGIAEQATDVRRLLTSTGATPGPGPAGDRFRAAMEALWTLHLAAAEEGFDATLRAFPQHTLAPAERAHAAALAGGDFALEGRRRRDLLLAVGILAGVVALACAAGLARPALRGRGPSATGR